METFQYIFFWTLLLISPDFADFSLLGKEMSHDQIRLVSCHSGLKNGLSDQGRLLSLSLYM